MSSNLTPNARTLFWVTLLGLVGGLLQAKAAIIEANDVLVGVFVGGMLGLLLGRLFAVLSKRERKESKRFQD